MEDIPVQWSTAAAAAELEEEEDAIKFDYKKVRWLPLMTNDDEGREGELVMPIFPLDEPYLPGMSHTLNIFEPRYCEMYSDVILSGSRRFVVPLFMRPPADDVEMPRQPAKMGTLALAEVGVVFYVEDFQKVEEETDGIIKYVCTHKVIGRAQIKRILNPGALVHRKTYARAVVEEIVDLDEGVDCSEKEKEVSALFREVVRLHNKLKDSEPVRFSMKRMPAGNLMDRGNDGQFWENACLWQSLFRERVLVQRVNKAKSEQRVMVEWLKEKGVDLTDIVGSEDVNNIGFRMVDTPPDLEKRYRPLREQFEEETLWDRSVLLWFCQLLVQEPQHAERLRLMEFVIARELQRLRARVSLWEALKGK